MSRLQKRVNEFKQILDSNSIDIDSLKKLTFYGGVPDSSGYRSIIWKLLFSYLPLEKNLWIETLQQKRQVFEEFKKDLGVIQFNSVKEKDDLKRQLEQEIDSSKANLEKLQGQEKTEFELEIKDKELRLIIIKDVERTRQTMSFFHIEEDSPTIIPKRNNNPQISNNPKINKTQEKQTLNQIPSLISRERAKQLIQRFTKKNSNKNKNKNQNQNQNDKNKEILNISTIDNEKKEKVNQVINEISSKKARKIRKGYQKEISHPRSQTLKPVKSSKMKQLNLNPRQNSERNILVKEIQTSIKKNTQKEQKIEKQKNKKVKNKNKKNKNKEKPIGRVIRYENPVAKAKDYRENRLVDLCNILYIYARLNNGIRYVQGMNSIAAPFLFLFGNDFENNNYEFAEADAFFCFTNLMGEINHHFCESVDDTEVGILALVEVVDNILKIEDSELWQHLNSLQILPQFYSMNWISLLCSQLFQMPDVIRIWDSLFADENRFEFLFYFCAALPISIRDLLLPSDYFQAITLLQNFPQDKTADELIFLAFNIFQKFQK
ncbi:tbc1 domain family member 13-like [Anaeramoeba ignava]|uniref:Tbc1 domain family member 13-like n=1 Tax=Anaeramoeba ignava TaxID=1746090 RepID=A0A9Q0R7I1_ANAIG|nr:tbc1 domain family member 13-like [Anaeramoeba ignava]